VVQQVTVGDASCERHHQGADGEVSGLTFTHRPAREALVAQVLDAGEEELAVDAKQVTRGCGVGFAAPPAAAAVHAD
jgi:hypothetical protein